MLFISNIQNFTPLPLIVLTNRCKDNQEGSEIKKEIDGERERDREREGCIDLCK